MKKKRKATPNLREQIKALLDTRTAKQKDSLPTSIRLPIVLKDRLKQLAVARRQPLSLMIVYVLEQWAAQFPPSTPTKVEK